MTLAMLGISIALGVGNFAMLIIIFQKLDTPRRGRRAP